MVFVSVIILKKWISLLQNKNLAMHNLNKRYSSLIKKNLKYKPTNLTSFSIESCLTFRPTGICKRIWLSQKRNFREAPNNSELAYCFKIYWKNRYKLLFMILKPNRILISFSKPFFIYFSLQAPFGLLIRLKRLILKIKLFCKEQIEVKCLNSFFTLLQLGHYLEGWLNMQDFKSDLCKK